MPSPRTGNAPAAAAALLAALLAGSAGAEPLNGLSAEISIGVSGSDNVRSAASGAEKSDAYFTFSPRVTLKRRLAFGEFSLAGGGNAYVYSQETDLNQIFYEAGTELTLPFTSRIEVELSDSFHPAPLTFSDTADARVNQIQTNRAVGTIHYSAPLGGPWEGRLSAQGERMDLIDSDNVFTGPKPDRTTVSGAGLLRRRMGRRSDLSLEASLGRTLFDQETSNPPPQPNFSDFTLFSGVLTWNFRPRKSLALAAGGGAGGIFSGGRDHFTGTALGSLTWESGERTQVRFEARRSQSAQTDGQTFASTVFSLTASHHLTRRLEAKAEGAVTLLSGVGYNFGDTRLYSAGPSLALTLSKYLEAQLRYQYSRRDTDLAGGDFGRNVGTLVLTARY